MIKIEHVAIWVSNLEKMRDFYVRYFNGRSNQKYHNPTKRFTSYFISFDDGARLELMHQATIPSNLNNVHSQNLGYIHLAISLGSPQAVDDLTNQLRQDGYPVIGEPRTTGDGYYESVILDPENNRLEITE